MKRSAVGYATEYKLLREDFLRFFRQNEHLLNPGSEGAEFHRLQRLVHHYEHMQRDHWEPRIADLERRVAESELAQTKLRDLRERPLRSIYVWFRLRFRRLLGSR